MLSYVILALSLLSLTLFWALLVYEAGIYDEIISPKLLTESGVAQLDFWNASSIFNAVNGALKQKDNNLNPNGLTYFPAYIPANTPLYHATSKTEVPKSYEWIAMDYEFSFNFGNLVRNQGPDAPNNLFLYTFKSRKPLDKLIYFDGASASKLRQGQMDHELLLTGEDFDYIGEYEAAKIICEIGRPYGLQGLVRLEIGYEVILCNFSELELVSNITNYPISSVLFKEADEDDFTGAHGSLFTSITRQRSLEHLLSGERSNSGDKRILIDYTKMVTAITRSPLEKDPYLRRLYTLPANVKDDLVKEVWLNVKTPSKFHEQNDWQALTEHIEDKFGPLLLNINNSLAAYPNESWAAEKIVRFTYNYVRRYTNDDTSESKREVALAASAEDHVYHAFPLRTEAEHLIYTSIYSVHEVLFNAVFTSYECAKDILNSHECDLKKLKLRISTLINALHWLTFVRCHELCKDDEVCYTPTWGPSPVLRQRQKQFLDFTDERYRIKDELFCVTLDDLIKSW